MASRNRYLSIWQSRGQKNSQKQEKSRRGSRLQRRKQRYFAGFLLPSLLGVLLFVLLPFGDVCKRSFQSAVTGVFQGLQNYQVIFYNQAFLLAVKNTLQFTLVSIPLLLMLGFFLALPLSGLRNTGWIKAFYLLPLAIPTATVVLVWKMTFYRQGFANLLLTRLGQITGLWGEVYRDYLGTNAAFWVLVFSYIWKNIGYTILLWLAGIGGIPGEQIEAARVDGAGRWKQIWYILLPNLRGSLFTILILSFLNIFKIYREAYLVAGAYPHKSIYQLQHVFNNWFVNLEFDKMAAAAVCVTVFLLLFILCFLMRIVHRDT